MRWAPAHEARPMAARLRVAARLRRRLQGAPADGPPRDAGARDRPLPSRRAAAARLARAGPARDRPGGRAGLLGAIAEGAGRRAAVPLRDAPGDGREVRRAED